jgi:hypothetical protein
MFPVTSPADFGVKVTVSFMVCPGANIICPEKPEISKPEILKSEPFAEIFVIVKSLVPWLLTIAV